MASLDRALSDFRNQYRMLTRTWNSARSTWTDTTAVRYERDYWQSMDKELRHMMEEMGKLNEVLTSARRQVK